MNKYDMNYVLLTLLFSLLQKVLRLKLVRILSLQYESRRQLVFAYDENILLFLEQFHEIKLTTLNMSVMK